MTLRVRAVVMRIEKAAILTFRFELGYVNFIISGLQF